MPVAGLMSVVEMENSLYALGGNRASIQKLSLDSLTWELMQLMLPQAVNHLPCFKTDTEVYLVIKKTLYSFTPLQVKVVKRLPKFIGCCSCYYSSGILYYENGRKIRSLALGI
jgi:hypothetical protein